MNFYESVKYRSPALAADIHEDVMLVGIGALCEDKSQVQDAVERLRTAAFDLPVLLSRVLDNALEELGFDLAENSSP